MIYFDKNKQAYGFEIENPLAILDDNTWGKYAGTDKWDIINGIFVDITTTPEYIAKELEKAKNLKIEENTKKRDERLRSGVEYKGVMFDSDTDSKVNIMGAISTLPDEAIVGWNSMDNQTITLTKAELAELGGLLVKLTSVIWGEGGLNIQYLKAINSAKNLQELESIKINYPLSLNVEIL